MDCRPGPGGPQLRESWVGLSAAGQLGRGRPRREASAPPEVEGSWLLSRAWGLAVGEPALGHGSPLRQRAGGLHKACALGVLFTHHPLRPSSRGHPSQAGAPSFQGAAWRSGVLGCGRTVLSPGPLSPRGRGGVEGLRGCVPHPSQSLPS